MPGLVGVAPRQRPVLPLETISAPLLLTLDEGHGEEAAPWGTTVEKPASFLP